MSTQTIRSLLQERFDADYISPEGLLKAHIDYFGSASFYSTAKGYSKKRLDYYVTQLENGNHVFCPSLFHCMTGCLITGQQIDKNAINRITDYVLSLEQEGGFLTISRKYLDQFPKLKAAKVSPMVPEVYSSYYSFFLLKILGTDIKESELEKLLSWIIAHQKSSGAIYNNTYSNTNESRRFEAEISCQTYFGTSLISTISQELPQFDFAESLINAKNWAMEKWLSLRTITSRYFVLKTIKLVSPEEISNVGFSEGLGFLSDRADGQGEGFFDYRLSDKIDEDMTSACAIGLDKISPHIFSTYYGATIMRIFWQNGYSLTLPHEQIKKLTKKAANEDGGFGMKVLVKDFPKPYGPISTELETLLVLLFPLMTKINV
jgi:hypothetical protein